MKRSKLADKKKKDFSIQNAFAGFATVFASLVALLALLHNTPLLKPPLVLASVTITGGGGEVIRDALLSVVDFVDKCVILDTGITDDTLDIARQAAGKKLVVVPWSWRGDFAAARNAALDAAESVGATWAIVLDTDERMRSAPGGDWRKALASSKADVLDLMHDSGRYAKPRAFRLPRRASYRGRTHEWVAMEEGAIKSELPANLLFEELSKDAEGYRRKALRDVAILEQETAANPHDQRWWYYLGDAHAILEDCESAVHAWNTCINITSGWDEEGAWCAYRASQCLWEKDAEEAMAVLKRGMARHARLPELPWYTAWILHKTGQQKAALKWARKAAMLGCVEGPCESRLGFRHPPASYESPYDVMRFALRELGDHDAAKLMDAKFEAALAKRLRTD